MTVRATLSSLVEPLVEHRLLGGADTSVQGLAYDSRCVQPGDLFAALPGADLDGHGFVEDAAKRGASALLVERETTTPLPQIVVPDSRAALATVAARLYEHPSRELNVIGVTGTDGKTTTSHLIDAILRRHGLRTGMVGTVAVRIGEQVVTHETRQTTPESADIQRYLRAMVEVATRWAVLEATSHGLVMHRLDHVGFDIAAVTNVTREHLDFHGSVEQYRQAKAILFERTAANGGVAIINADDPGALSMRAYCRGITTFTYSATGQPASLRAVNVEADPRGSSFRLETAEWGATDVRLPLLGNFNVANALCAAGVALAAGLDLPAVASGLAAAPPVPGRMVNLDAGQPFSVVVDYAHTPEALAHILPLLRRLHPGGQLITVFGSAGERDREKRGHQGAIAARLADFAVFTNEDPRHEDPGAIIAQIAAGARDAGGREGETFLTMPDRREAIRAAFERARPGDCVLLAGKGHEQSIIVGREKQPWNEAAVAKELLAERGWAAR